MLNLMIIERIIEIIIKQEPKVQQVLKESKVYLVLVKYLQIEFM